MEQSPSESMLTALRPAIMGLTAKELLENVDTNVHVAVTTCISEITRITAPEAPYDDDLMKVLAILYQKYSHYHFLVCLILQFENYIYNLNVVFSGDLSKDRSFF